MRYSLHWSSGCGVQRNYSKCAKKVASSVSSSDALQDSTWDVQGDLSRWKRSAAQNTLALLKPTNPRESVWKELYIIIMKTTLQGKESIHWVITILCTHLFLCLKQWRYMKQKQQWIKNGTTAKDSGMAADVSQKQERGDRWSKERRQNSAFFVVTGHLSSQDFGIGTKISKNTEAELYSEVPLMRYSQSKVHLLHKWRLQKKWMSQQGHQDAQDKQQTQYQLTPRSKWKMLPNCWKFRSQNDQVFGFLFQNTDGRNHGPVWKTQSFLLNEICTVIFWQGLLCERQFEKILLAARLGRRFPNWECLFVHREKGIFFSVHVDDTNWLGKTKHWPNVESTYERSRLGRANIILDHVHLGCTQPTCETSKEMVDNQLKNYHARKIFVSLRGPTIWWEHAKECVERYCDLANKTTPKPFTITTSCLDDHQFKEEELESVGELSKICSQMVLKCVYLVRIGRPDILWSVNKLCTIDYKMDQNLWQTIVSFDLLHSSHKWLPTILSCGKHGSTMQVGTVSGPWFCRKSWRLKFDLGENLVYLWKSHLRSHKLDVQDTIFCFTLFDRIWK